MLLRSVENNFRAIFPSWTGHLMAAPSTRLCTFFCLVLYVFLQLCIEIFVRLDIHMVLNGMPCYPNILVLSAKYVPKPLCTFLLAKPCMLLVCSLLTKTEY